jgi:hypothetical protein
VLNHLNAKQYYKLKKYKKQTERDGEYYSGGNFTIESLPESKEPPMTLDIGDWIIE